MKNSRLLPAALLVLGIVGLMGCALLQGLLGSGPKPSARIVAVRVSDFSLAGLTLVFDVAIHNPYTVSLPLVNVDYALASGPHSFLQGQAPLQGAVPARGTQTVSLPAKVVFAELIKVLQAARPGTLLPYRGTLGLAVHAPVVGTVRLPLEKEGQLPVPAPPSVSLASVRWHSLSLAGASGVVNLRVTNPNAFPFQVAALDYGIKLGGLDVAAGGLVNAADIGINVALSTARAGLALSQLVRGQSSSYTLGGGLTIGTPFGPLRLPVSISGQVPFVR